MIDEFCKQIRIKNEKLRRKTLLDFKELSCVIQSRGAQKHTRTTPLNTQNEDVGHGMFPTKRETLIQLTRFTARSSRE